MELDYKIDPKKTYIVAVSFGPDSMCLLSLLLKQTNKLVVGHVNYHKRLESNSEQIRLEDYCKTHNIKCEILDTNGLTHEGNFQKWARELRYNFFHSLEQKYNAECVFVAHQQDDLIETYLMQKNKQNYVKYWGIAKENVVKKANIVRPLLKYSKQELENYCKENNVPYAIDSSNLENHYSRNKVRHFVVEKLDQNQRTKILKEIEELNKLKSNNSENSILISKFVSLSYDEVVDLISNYLHSENKHIDLSKDFVISLQSTFRSKKSNISVKLIDNIFIAKEYGKLIIFNQDKISKYSYFINMNDIIDDNLFTIDLSHDFKERNLNENSFPISIKPLDKDDVYKISGYDCKIRRLLIDWKVPPHLRSVWPGIYDKNGTLVYVPRYKETYIDTHKSKFIIKFTK